jgi:sulfate/thiosulfate transport system permease protein
LSAGAPARALDLGRSLRAPRLGAGLGVGLAVSYLTVMVLLPLAALLWTSLHGTSSFWTVATSDRSLNSLKLTLLLAFGATVVNVVMGTVLAWVLVRDRFPGQRVVDAVIDLPFALPTIVAGLTLLALYGPRGPLEVSIAYTRIGILMALLFVTLPFVVRSVQPVLEALDREVEEAAATLGANGLQRMRHIVLPSLAPAILSGAGLSFAKAMGEFGAVVLIAGNIPFKTEVSSVNIFGLIEADDPQGAAALSVVILVISLVVLMGIGFLERWMGRRGN